MICHVVPFARMPVKVANEGLAWNEVLRKSESYLEEYSCTLWVVPPPSNSHHQDYIFCRETL